MKKKLITLFLLPLMVTACKKNSSTNLDSLQAKNYIIENYTFNKANYFYQKATYSIERTVSRCQGIYPNAQNNNGDFIFTNKIIKEGDAPYFYTRNGRSDLDVLNYEELNDFYASDKKVNTDYSTKYVLENECLSISFNGVDSLEKILKLPYVNTITNNLEDIVYDKSFNYEIKYQTNEVGLYSKIELSLSEQDSNSNAVDVSYVMTFNWVVR